MGTQSTGSSPWRRLSIALLIPILSVALILAVCEVAFRVFVDVTDIAFYYWDPAVGPRIAPNQSGRYLLGRFVDGRYRFNAQGWNHPQDYVTGREAGGYRICLVGDSYVEAMQVQPQETMYAVAQRLMDRPKRSAQWYSFGVSGFGTSHEYEVIRKYVLEYDPDLVILLFVQNDPFDASPYIRDLPPHSVRYVLDGAGDLRRFAPTEWAPVRWRRLAARSALVRYFLLQQPILHRLRKRAEGRGAGGEPLREGVGASGSAIADGLEHLSVEDRGRMTWELIATLLEKIHDECHRRGARFAIAFRGWAEEIDSPLEPESFEPVPESEDPHCLEGRQREMGRHCLAPIARRLGIPYLDLTAALRAAVASSGKSHRFPQDRHYSAVGHAAAGEALAAWAEELLAPAGRGEGVSE
jgi:hypothetical protein